MILVTLARFVADEHGKKELVLEKSIDDPRWARIPAPGDMIRTRGMETAALTVDEVILGPDDDVYIWVEDAEPSDVPFLLSDGWERVQDPREGAKRSSSNPP